MELVDAAWLPARYFQKGLLGFAARNSRGEERSRYAANTE